MAEDLGWAVHCGCGHGDHLACDTNCGRFGYCRHPVGMVVSTEKEKWADRYSGMNLSEVPAGRVKVESPNADLANRILAALEAYQEANEYDEGNISVRMATREGRLAVITKVLDEEKT